MVSSSHPSSNSAKGTSLSKKHAKSRSPSPSRREREFARYEFDAKVVPKGHRTDREKKKVFVKKTSPSPASAAEPEREAAEGERPVEQLKHLKRLRTGRASKILRNKPEHEADVEEQKVADGDVSKKTVGVDDGKSTEENEMNLEPDEKQNQEPAAAPEEPENNVAGPVEETKTPETEKVDEGELLVSRTENVHAADDEMTPTENHPDGSKEDVLAADVDAAKVDRNEVAEEPKVVAAVEPDTSLSLGLSGPHHRVRRVRSIPSMSQVETFSHGVTTSLSLSCSHQFTHNPSCSLMTQTSFDNQEFSSASQPVVHQEATVSAGGDGRRFGEYARSSRDFSSKGRAAASEGQQHSHYSHPKGSMHKKQLKGGGLSRSAGCSVRERPGVVTVREIVSEPVQVVARKMQDLPSEVLEELKATVKELLECGERREEFLHLQRILQSRSDFSDEVLQMTHRAQLGILVALKTGIPAFLSQEQQPKILVEVFLHQRCRNVQCLNQLPVDNCECTVCTQKSGFCNACMCVVCSKFDFEHNTCSWVGCDYCIHWCHTDCGLRKSHVKPGQAIRGSPGASEMQFHCIACGKTSELFGFVKDVFTSCAETWNRATLSKELDCVKRMFQGSEDLRGKQLCWKAGQLITKLENNEGAADACKSMLRFFEDGTILPSEEENAAATTTASIVERATMALQTYDRVLEEKRSDAAEMQYERARKKAEIEELESIVRIKQAEAKMFQARADEASREAEGLRRIVLAKCLKVEEEYAAKKSKLQLLEAEEKRKRKFENLKLLEAGSYNFDIVRKLMGDLQGLLTNMEVAKRLKSEDISSVDKYLQRYLQPR